MSRIISEEEILIHLDEVLMNIESDDEFMDDIELCETDDEDDGGVHRIMHSPEQNIPTVELPNMDVHNLFQDVELETSVPEPSATSVGLTETNKASVQRPQRLRGNLTAPNFKWKKHGQFQPKIYKFDSIKCGVQKDEFELHENSTALECFEALVTPFLMGKVAFETNRYYKQVMEKEMMSSRTSHWSDTTAEEMNVFIIITMLMTRNC